MYGIAGYRKRLKDIKIMEKVIEKDDIDKSMEIKKLPKCKKGDIIIVELKKEITAGLAMYLEAILTKKFPDNKSLVLCNGAKLYPLPKNILNSMGWFEKKKSFSIKKVR